MKLRYVIGVIGTSEIELGDQGDRTNDDIMEEYTEELAEEEGIWENLVSIVEENGVESHKVTLELLDDEDNVVRTFSDEKTPDGTDERLAREDDELLAEILLESPENVVDILRTAANLEGDLHVRFKKALTG